MLDARKILKTKARFTILKGWVCICTCCYCCTFFKIPTIIHESDLTPGLANKIALKFAKKIYTTFEDTLNYLPKDKADFVGATVREDLKQGDQQRGYQLTEFKPDKRSYLLWVVA